MMNVVLAEWYACIMLHISFKYRQWYSRNGYMPAVYSCGYVGCASATIGQLRLICTTHLC